MIKTFSTTNGDMHHSAPCGVILVGKFFGHPKFRRR